MVSLILLYDNNHRKMFGRNESLVFKSRDKNYD